MKQKVKFSCVLLAVWVSFVFISCTSSPAAYVGIDATVLDGSFENALVKLDEEKNKPGGNTASIYKNPRNEILYYIDRGVIAHYAGLYQESFENLETAERLIEEAYTKSITQEIGSYIVNDNVRDYPGEDYEDLYINIFNALNFYHTGNLEGALVEIRRLNEKANHLADKYERATKKVMESNQQMSGQISTEASRFSNSALARYMGILFYRAAGNPDSVRVEHEELQRAYSLAPGVYTNPVPSSVKDELSVPAAAARLNVIAFTGLSPVKEEESIMIPLPLPAPNNSARVALPKMVARPQPVNRVEVVLDSGEKFNLELLEDMGAVARETFKSRYALTVAKSTARAIIKATAGAAAAQAAKRGNAIAGLAVGIASRVAAEVSEKADTRLSRYFPNYAFVGGINLEPGTYRMTINFYGGGGLVNSQEREVSVQRNALNLEQLVCLGNTSAPAPSTSRPSSAAVPIAAGAPKASMSDVPSTAAAEEAVVASAPPTPEPVVPGGAAAAQTPLNLNISGYFVNLNGQPAGPLSGPELRELINHGQLTRDTLVWKEGMPNWAPAWTGPEVAPLFASAVPPPLPPLPPSSLPSVEDRR